jgi:hypothetical protein
MPKTEAEFNATKENALFQTPKPFSVTASNSAGTASANFTMLLGPKWPSSITYGTVGNGTTSGMYLTVNQTASLSPVVVGGVPTIYVATAYNSHTSWGEGEMPDGFLFDQYTGTLTALGCVVCVCV